MRILITGYTGFVGSNLIKSLKKDQLIGIDIIKNDSVLAHYLWQDIDKINNIDCIIHLAGKAHDTKNTTEEKAYFDINVGLTIKIFEYFLQSNATKFIFFSSVKAVADTVNGAILSEDAEPKPGTAYGKSKLEAERFIWERLDEYTKSLEEEKGKWGEGEKSTAQGDDNTIARRREGETERLSDDNKVRKGESEKTNSQWDESTTSRKEEKKVYILRPCMIHGPGNKGNLNLLFKLVSKGIPWPLGAFENKRSFTSIENLKFVILQLIENDIESGTYQVADDEALSTNKLISLISASQGKKAGIWKINSKLITFVAHIGDKLNLPLNTERLKKLTESYVVSNSKLKKALKIEKMPVSAEEGMKKTLSSF